MNKRDKATSAGVDVTSWIHMCESLDEYYTDQYEKEKAKANVPPTWQYYNPARFTTNGSQGGDQRLRTLRSALKFYDANGTKRSKHQVQFHDAFIAACIRNIYKSEFSANYMRILKDNDWDECRQEVLVCCPHVLCCTAATCVDADVHVDPRSSPRSSARQLKNPQRRCSRFSVADPPPSH